MLIRELFTQSCTLGSMHHAQAVQRRKQMTVCNALKVGRMLPTPSDGVCSARVCERYHADALLEKVHVMTSAEVKSHLSSLRCCTCTARRDERGRT